MIWFTDEWHACTNTVLTMLMYVHVLIFPSEAEKERAATDQAAGAGLGRE